MAVAQFFEGVVFQVAYIVIFLVSLYALIECLRTRPDAYPAANKQTKKLWLGLTGGSALLSLLAVFGLILFLRFFVILGLIAVIIYFVDVRPAVRSMGNSSEGPYGPW